MYGTGDKRYRITFVDDEALPAELDFAFLECGGDVWLALKCSQINEPALEDAWAAFRAAWADGSIDA